MGIAMNVAIGLLVTALKLPIFLDAIGTILFALVGGWRLGAIIGVLSSFVAGMFNPVLPYFAPTQFGIAVAAAMAARQGLFSRLWQRILTGIVIGFVAAILSAPVVALVFGGVTTSGESLITGFFVATGRNLWAAVTTTKLITEPLDKTLQTLAAYALVKSMPKNLLQVLKRLPGYLDRNGL